MKLEVRACKMCLGVKLATCYIGKKQKKEGNFAFRKAATIKISKVA